MSESKAERRRRKRAKAGEMFWSRQPAPIRLQTKSRTRAQGRAFSRELRDNQFKGGTTVTVECCPLGRMNSTGTRVESSRTVEIRTGKTWVRKGIR